MYRTLGTAAVFALLGAGGALAQDDIMAAMYDNTTSVTYADGSQVDFFINADASFTTNTDAAGTWRLSNGAICLAVSGAEEESCTTLDGVAHQVGDAWTLTDGDGAELGVTLVAGRGATADTGDK